MAWGTQEHMNSHTHIHVYKEKGNTGTGTSSSSALHNSTGLRTGDTITRKNSQRREFLFTFSQGKLLVLLRLWVISLVCSRQVQFPTIQERMHFLRSKCFTCIGISREFDRIKAIVSCELEQTALMRCDSCVLFNENLYERNTVHLI